MKLPSFDRLTGIADAACAQLHDQGLTEQYKRQHANDMGVTYFVAIPDLGEVPCRLSVVITMDQRVHLVFVTASHGHYLMDVTDRLSRSFCAEVVFTWARAAIALAERLKSPHWQHDDWMELDSESGVERFEAGDGSW